MRTSLENSVRFTRQQCNERGRLTKKDKMDVLMNLIGTNQNFTEIKEIEKYVTNNEIITMSNLEKMYYEEKNKRMRIQRELVHRVHLEKQNELDRTIQQIQLETNKIHQIQRLIYL